MSIVRDAVSKQTVTNTTNTFAHVMSGVNTALIVGVRTNGAGDDIAGVTYNGVGMTRIDKSTNTNTSYLYYLSSPTGGSNNIVISSTGASILIEGEGVSYTGVLQSGQPEAHATATASASATVANIVTTVADNAVHIVVYGVNTSNPATVTNGTITNTNFMAESNPLLITPAGSNTMTGNGAVQDWTSCGISLAPAPDVATGGDFAYFL